jgi:5-oxopent-3-ene-1,2,5-tricarboxylate decarboxylase / 2-hydroxyhepta-2,4-diene-1,7-dioate isomerase
MIPGTICDMGCHPLGIRPSKIIAVHQNYRSRVAERGAAMPDVPSYFLKPPSSLAISGEPLVRPADCELLTFEGEIALVIGKRAKLATIDAALDHVAGLTVANDAGVADLRWPDSGSNLRSKGQDGYTPVGSELVPVRPGDDVVLRTYLNGAVVQDSAGDEMLFGFAQLVADLSRFTTLEPGDLILCGTPAGASVAVPGDVVEVEIVSGPRLSNEVTQSQRAIPRYGAMPRADESERARAYGSAGARSGAGGPRPDGPDGLAEGQRRSLMELGTATLSSQLRKLGVDHHAISGLRCSVAAPRLAGVARTLRYLPLREDMFEQLGGGFNAQKRAVDTLRTGEVLVIDARGVPDAGTIGDLLVKTAVQRGAAGIVTDGGLRDVELTSQTGCPVFYGSSHPAVLGHRHVPADSGLPVACGGAFVSPGDVIVGDLDGIIVVPHQLVGTIITGARQQALEERYIEERILAGDSLRQLYPLTAATRPAFEAWAAGLRETSEEASDGLA